MWGPFDEDPTDFEGTLSAVPLLADDSRSHKPSTSNAATGVTAAGARALAARLIAFYFRAPVKAFLRGRVDYLQYARETNPRAQANARWSWHTSTPGLLVHAVRTHGWSFIPNQVLPPLLANVALVEPFRHFWSSQWQVAHLIRSVGAVLYTSYLQILGAVHPPAAKPKQRMFPPPSVLATFTAGFAAGAVQSVVAAPLDALQARFSVSELARGRYKSMWAYGRRTLHEIGLRGIFTGWGLSFLKESLGYGVFFATFEYCKQQLYYSFLSRYQSSAFRTSAFDQLWTAQDQAHGNIAGSAKPHFAFEPCFVLFAGVAASVTQQLVQYPLGRIQSLHYSRLVSLDRQHHHRAHPHRRSHHHQTAPSTRYYFKAYAKTLQHARHRALQAGGWRVWLFSGLLSTTLRQIPSTSAGLFVFELVRRRYGVPDSDSGSGSGSTSSEEPEWVEWRGRHIVLS